MELLIQHSMVDAYGLAKIREAVIAHSIPHQFVGLIPFSDEVVADTQLEGVEYQPYGSTKFVEIAHKRGWTGLYYDPEKFRVSEWAKHDH